MDTIDPLYGVRQLQKLQHAFEAADEDGSGELEMTEFLEKLGPLIGSEENMSMREVAKLFMKIDADSNGGVDWNEFTNYMFLNNQNNDVNDATGGDVWRLFPQEFPSHHNGTAVQHKDLCSRLKFLPAIDKYVTAGADGTMRLWQADALTHFKTIGTGASWITDFVYSPSMRQIVTTSMDRAISFYDVSRGSYDLAGRLMAGGAMGVPMCVSTMNYGYDDHGEGVEHIVYGDDVGAVILLKQTPKLLPARDLHPSEDGGDLLYIHKSHSEWVTRVLFEQTTGHLVSSSLDSTIKCADASRQKVVLDIKHHSKGVHDLAWIVDYSQFVSCGLERDLILWQGTTGRKTGSLVGHTSSVIGVTVDQAHNMVYSLSTDKMIKVWDLRVNKAVQTLTVDDWENEDNHPTVLAYDGVRDRLVTSVAKPFVWHNKCVSQLEFGHTRPVSAVLYNHTFEVVVSGCEDAVVCVWNILNGERLVRFDECHPKSKITAMAFDSSQRRLITGAHDGSVRLWNFNNGALLKEFFHNDPRKEVAVVLFAPDKMRSSNVVLAAGWNSRIYLWEDVPNKMQVRQYRTFDGHEEDINCMAFQPPQLLASGDFGGNIHVWNIYSGDKRVSIQLDKDVAGESLNHWDLSVEELLFVPGRHNGGKPRTEAKPGDPLGILMAGVDGSVRLFDISHMPRSRQLLRINVSSGSLESVCCMSIDMEQNFFAIGDTSGHVRVWNISKLDMAQLPPDNVEDCFVEIAHFRAHQEAVTSISVVFNAHDTDSVMKGGSYVVAGSNDTTVTMWTTDGVQLGAFGRGSRWDTLNPATWLGTSDEAKALEMDTLYYKSVQHEDSGGSDEEAAEEDEVFQGLDPASKVLAQRRMAHILGKARNPINSGVHSNLMVHGITDVPEDFEEVRTNYGGAHRERKQKGRRGRRAAQ